MKTYNRSLDYVALALASYRQGKPELAAKLFTKAATQADTPKAVAILEASNHQAHTAMVKAATAKVEAKPKVPVKAAKRLEADSEFDMDEDEVNSLVGDDEGEGAETPEPEAMPEVEAAPAEECDPEDGDETDELDDEEFDKQFAKVLSSMHRKAKK